MFKNWDYEKDKNDKNLQQSFNTLSSDIYEEGEYPYLAACDLKKICLETSGSQHSLF